jgi:DNA-binding Xre family transcriptional regulator
VTPEQLQALRAIPVGTLKAGNRFAVALTMTGTKQGAIAEGTGIDQSRLSAISLGKRPAVTHDEAQKIARFIGCDSLDIFPLADAECAA